MVYKKHRSPLTKILLNFLTNIKAESFELGELIGAFSSRYGSAYLHGGSGYVAELKQLAKEQKIRLVLRCLQRSRYIKAQKIGQRLIISLINKGKIATLTQQLCTAPLHKPNCFTIVIFDIPESQRMTRLQLRTFLKQGNFWLLQRSVWVSDRDCRQMIADFLKRLNLERWVNVYYATNLLQSPKK